MTVGGAPTNRKKARSEQQREILFVTVRFGFRGGRNTAGRPDKNLSSPTNNAQRAIGNE
jgi:hypothetical protein